MNAAGVELSRPDQWRLIQETYALWGEKLPRLTVQARLWPGYDRFENLKTGAESTIPRH